MGKMVNERPLLPSGPDYNQLLRSLHLEFTERGYRSNLSVLSDGSELTDMQAFAHVTRPEFTANQDDYDLGSQKTLYRLTSDASRDLTGIAGGTVNEAGEGRVLILVNVGSNNIVLKHDTTSAVANRFAINADVTLLPDQAAKLWYDVTSSRWRLMA